ncbi:MAG: hypothetical protein ACRDT6_21075 [Micromonosporaceae bacterium]
MAVLLLATLAGCVGGKDADYMQPTVSVREAKVMIDRHIKDIIAQLPDNAEPKSRGGVDGLPCTWSDAPDADKRVIVESWYRVENLPVAEYPSYFESIGRHWRELGYRKVRFDKQDAMWTMAYADPEGFVLSFGTTGSGEVLTIKAASPCIWQNGTPEPDGE